MLQLIPDSRDLEPLPDVVVQVLRDAGDLAEELVVGGKGGEPREDDGDAFLESLSALRFKMVGHAMRIRLSDSLQ